MCQKTTPFLQDSANFDAHVTLCLIHEQEIDGIFLKHANENLKSAKWYLRYRIAYSTSPSAIATNISNQQRTTTPRGQSDNQTVK